VLIQIRNFQNARFSKHPFASYKIQNVRSHYINIVNNRSEQEQDNLFMDSKKIFLVKGHGFPFVESMYDNFKEY